MMLSRRTFLKISLAGFGAALVPLAAVEAFRLEQVSEAERLRLDTWPRIALDLHDSIGNVIGTHRWLTDPDHWKPEFADGKISIAHREPLQFVCIESCVIAAMRIEDAAGVTLRKIESHVPRFMTSCDTYLLRNIVLSFEPGLFPQPRLLGEPHAAQNKTR